MHRFASRHRLFKGLVVCSTHLGSTARAAAEAAVLAMGGAWEDDLSSRATTLLCGAAFTAKARKSSLRTRLVTPAWLWETIRAARRQPEHDFKPALLHGVRVAVSGMPGPLRTKVREIVSRCGGEYHESLRHPVIGAHQGTTHLLIVARAASSSEKLAAAGRWGVPVLSLQWLSDSVARGRCADPERYVNVC